MSTPTLPCFTCGVILESAFSDKIDSGNVQQPYAGTTFKSWGQYGSTIFDPDNGSMLEINICDRCLTVNLSRVGYRRASKRAEPLIPWSEVLGNEDLLH